MEQWSRELFGQPLSWLKVGEGVLASRVLGEPKALHTPRAMAPLLSFARALVTGEASSLCENEKLALA